MNQGEVKTQKTKQNLKLSINLKVYLRKTLSLKCPKCNSQEVETIQILLMSECINKIFSL